MELASDIGFYGADKKIVRVSFYDKSFKIENNKINTLPFFKTTAKYQDGMIKVDYTEPTTGIRVKFFSQLKMFLANSKVSLHFEPDFDFASAIVTASYMMLDDLVLILKNSIRAKHMTFQLYKVCLIYFEKDYTEKIVRVRVGRKDELTPEEIDFFINNDTIDLKTKFEVCSNSPNDPTVLEFIENLDLSNLTKRVLIKLKTLYTNSTLIKKATDILRDNSIFYNMEEMRKQEVRYPKHPLTVIVKKTLRTQLDPDSTTIRFYQKIMCAKYFRTYLTVAVPKDVTVAELFCYYQWFYFIFKKGNFVYLVPYHTHMDEHRLDIRLKVLIESSLNVNVDIDDSSKIISINDGYSVQKLGEDMYTKFEINNFLGFAHDDDLLIVYDKKVSKAVNLHNYNVMELPGQDIDKVVHYYGKFTYMKDHEIFEIDPKVLRRQLRKNEMTEKFILLKECSSSLGTLPEGIAEKVMTTSTHEIWMTSHKGIPILIHTETHLNASPIEYDISKADQVWIDRITINFPHMHTVYYKRGEQWVNLFNFAFTSKIVGFTRGKVHFDSNFILMNFNARHLYVYFSGHDEERITIKRTIEI
ncbi:hypothetical protein [Carp edema virus]|nr:hypothetical protein [Carp edema virus]